MKKAYIPIQIEKVLELEGALINLHDTLQKCQIYAHISKPLFSHKENSKVQYVMLARMPQHGAMHLGEISQDRPHIFEYFDPDLENSAEYGRADNNIINWINVPTDQLDNLKPLEEILKIPRISVKRELIPEKR